MTKWVDKKDEERYRSSSEVRLCNGCSCKSIGGKNGGKDK